MTSAADIARVLGGKCHGHYWMCHCPAHDDQTPSLSVREGEDGKVLVKCYAGCSSENIIDELRRLGLWPGGRKAERERGRSHNDPEISRQRRPEIRTRDDPTVGDRARKATALWRNRRPIGDSLAARYLREVRGITCRLPDTLGFLPSQGDYPPTMIAAFGIAVEPEPGVISIAENNVHSVHLTRLQQDGSGKADEPAKIMLGSSLGLPIVLAPMNDLLGLAITEGIEDALSIHQATGLGAWAAGSASYLPALADAVPDFVDCLSILVDDNDAGRKGSEGLAERLRRRGIHVELIGGGHGRT